MLPWCIVLIIIILFLLIIKATGSVDKFSSEPFKQKIEYCKNIYERPSGNHMNPFDYYRGSPVKRILYTRFRCS